MYAALWRALPGNRLTKLVLCLVLASLVVSVLFTWVFPIVSGWLPAEQTTVPLPSPPPR